MLETASRMPEGKKDNISISKQWAVLTGERIDKCYFRTEMHHVMTVKMCPYETRSRT